MRIEGPSFADVAAANTLERQRRRSRQIRLAVVFLGCALLLDAVFGERGLFQTIKSREDLIQAAQEISELKRQNAALRREARRLQEDPAALELVARQQLGLLRPGEILVVLSDVK
ncbi:MAG TPA: septum formation initiator family protein [Vicinamibacterales bacterium]|nr:septum formation initiator family protein [Vicinamibacterales bacterium]